MALAIGSSNLVDLGSLSVTDYPFTLTGWFRVPSSSTLMTLMRVSNTTTGSYHGLNYEGHNANQVVAISRVSSTSAARSTAPMSANQWHQVTGVFESATTRRIYLDGGNQTEVNHERLFDGVDDFSLGNLATSTAVDAAEVALLDIALQDGDIQALAAGISPLMISDLSNLLCYHNCVRRLNHPGWGPVATSSGGTIATEHPRVLMPRGSQAVIQPCRFSGPYTVEQEGLQTDGAERAEVNLSGIENVGAEAFAA